MMELKASRKTIALLEKYIEREAAQDAQENANFKTALDLKTQAVELEQKRTELAQTERDLYKDKFEFYAAAYKALTKKRSIGCTIGMIVTVGIIRCN